MLNTHITEKDDRMISTLEECKMNVCAHFEQERMMESVSSSTAHSEYKDKMGKIKKQKYKHVFFMLFIY